MNEFKENLEQLVEEKPKNKVIKKFQHLQTALLYSVILYFKNSKLSEEQKLSYSRLALKSYDILCTHQGRYINNT